VPPYLLPEPLVTKNGEKVTTAEMWWKQRRPEIVEDFEREVIGRVPKDVPKVTWTVVSNVTEGLVGNLAANGKRLVGHVDNAACPAVNVDIRMTVVTPATAALSSPAILAATSGTIAIPDRSMISPLIHRSALFQRSNLAMIRSSGAEGSQPTA